MLFKFIHLLHFNLWVNSSSFSTEYCFASPKVYKALFCSGSQWEASDGRIWPMRGWDHITWPLPVGTPGRADPLKLCWSLHLVSAPANQRPVSGWTDQSEARTKGYLLSWMQSVLTSLFGSVSVPQCEALNYHSVSYRLSFVSYIVM